jgi:hypothetical protein
MESKQKKVKVEVGEYDHDEGVYNFVVHLNGGQIKSTIRLPMSVDALCINYLDKGYNVEQFKASMKIFVQHKDEQIIEIVKHITHEYFYNGAETPITQAQEISDWLDDDTVEWDEDWTFEGELEDEDSN